MLRFFKRLLQKCNPFYTAPIKRIDVDTVQIRIPIRRIVKK